MDIFHRMAEKRIGEAMKRGEFDDLPGRGKPLALEDDRSVPEDLRMAFKILKNAGCLPPEIELRKQIHSLRELLATVDDRERRTEIRRLIDYKILRFNLIRKTPFHLETFPQYEAKIIDRFTKNGVSP